jgi:MFS family permease
MPSLQACSSNSFTAGDLTAIPRRGRLQRWSSRYFAPWYLTYLILGLINSGMLPFLMPLLLAADGYGLDTIAWVVGGYNAGLLPAPLFGVLAERFRLFRPVFFGGFLAVAVALALASMVQVWGLALWAALALLAGLGAGAVATVAPLFVVGFTPKDEWNPRIGWLQGCSGAGQLAGLLLAGVIARGPLIYGFWLASALSLLALVVGRAWLPLDRDQDASGSPGIAWGDLIGRFHPLPPIGGLLHHSHHLQGAALRSLPRSLGGEFGRLLLAWASLNFGVAPFFACYPLIMRTSYGIAPMTTALLYASAAAVGIGLFVLAGRMAQRYTPRPVLRIGLALRLVGFTVLGVLVLARFSGTPVVAALGFTLVMLAWPVISVSGTGLAAQLTLIGEGAAMGLLTSSAAMATVFGTFLGGLLVKTLGYRAVPLIALAGLLGAEILIGRGNSRKARAALDKGSEL